MHGGTRPNRGHPLPTEPCTAGGRVPTAVDPLPIEAAAIEAAAKFTKRMYRQLPSGGRVPTAVNPLPIEAAAIEAAAIDPTNADALQRRRC